MFCQSTTVPKGFPGGAVVKNLPASAADTRDIGLIPESGRSPEIRNGNSLQYSCLENSMNRGAWQAAVHGVAKSQMLLSTHTHTHIVAETFLSKETKTLDSSTGEGLSFLKKGVWFLVRKDNVSQSFRSVNQHGDQ